MLSKPEIRCFKVTETETGNLAAWARWGFPHKFTEEEKAARSAEKKANSSYDWPEGTNLDIADIKFGALDRIRDQNVDYENDYCWFLSLPAAYHCDTQAPSTRVKMGGVWVLTENSMPPSPNSARVPAQRPREDDDGVWAGTC